MSSVHSVLQAPDRKQSIILRAISKILFDLPNQHRERLEQLWVDDLFYASAWRKHVSERIEDLRLKMIWVSQIATARLLCEFSSFLFLSKKDIRTDDVRNFLSNPKVETELSFDFQ